MRWMRAEKAVGPPIAAQIHRISLDHHPFNAHVLEPGEDGLGQFRTFADDGDARVVHHGLGQLHAGLGEGEGDFLHGRSGCSHHLYRVGKEKIPHVPQKANTRSLEDGFIYLRA